MNHNIHSKNKTMDRTRKLVILALFAAIAYLSMYIVNFKVDFLTFDIKNVFITVAAMLFGPVAGGILSLVVAFIEFLAISTTGFYGFVMNFLSSASFAVVAALLYRRKRTNVTAYLSLICATLASTAVMLLFNLIVTPFYMGVGVSVVAGMIPTLLFPFNLIKCLVNAAIVLIFYKPISVVLKRGGIIKSEEKPIYRLDKHTLFTWLLAVLVIVLSLVIFFLVLGGKISFLD